MPALKKPSQLCLVLILLGVGSLVPNLARDRILEGQIIKQTFSAEMAQSYSRGDQTGIYPHRHFLEVFYPDVIPWAEEVPIYTGAIGYTVRWTGLPLIPLGRCVSFAFFLLLLAAAGRLGRQFERELGRSKDKLELRWILPLVCAWFPVFRQYSVSFMPDMAMASCCLWGIVLAYELKWKRAASVLCVAALFKYFAVFTTLGLIGFLWVSEKKKWKAVKLSVLLALSAVPAVAYIGFFLLIHLPNPITEYRTINGHGHMASLEMLTSVGTYLRFCTWLLVKNPSVVGTGLAAWGTYWMACRKTLPARRLLGCLVLGYVLFMLVFAHGFYVHDYYGLQFSLVTAIVASIGLYALVQPIFWAAIAALMLSGFLMARSATIPQTHFVKAAELLNSWTKPEDRGLVISSLSPAVLIFQTGKTAWGVEPKDWNRLGSDTAQLLKDERVKWVAVYLVEPWATVDFQWISDNLARQGWTRIEHKQTVASSDRKVPTTRLWLLQRATP